VPLSLSVAPRLVVSGSLLTIHIQTRPSARVYLAFQVVTKKAVIKGHGQHRQRVWQTRVWYRLARQGNANRRGQFGARLRIAYRPTKPVPAWLTVTIHTAKGTASRTMEVTIQPRRQPAPASGRGRGHGDPCGRCLRQPLHLREFRNATDRRSCNTGSNVHTEGLLEFLSHVAR
jgi:hypothetical protein